MDRPLPGLRCLSVSPLVQQKHDRHSRRPWETYRAAKLLRDPSVVASITRKANDWAQSTDVLDAFALAEHTSDLEAAWHLLNGGVIVVCF
eukprot:14868803-Heterocapsa_arctica.AAC.1